MTNDSSQDIPTPDESGIRLSPSVYAVRVGGETVASYYDILDAIEASKAIGHKAGAEVVRIDGRGEVLMQRAAEDPRREVFSHREAERRERRMSMQTVARLLRSAS